MTSENKPTKNNSLEAQKQGLFKLNENQKTAIEAPNAPLLIVAGAGTGKTRTLTMRIAHLIEKGVPPNQICTLTFTNKAAEEMRRRILKIISSHPNLEEQAKRFKEDPPFMGTFHALGVRILRSGATLFGRTPSFTIFDDYDSLQLIRKIIRTIKKNKKDSKGDPEALTPAKIRDRISKIKNGMLQKKKLENSERVADQMILEILDSYEIQLQEHNAFDFDDLILKPVNLFNHRSETLEKWQRRFSYFFVDEYQDINQVQYQLIKLLSKATHHLSVVGDHHQTIYSWRGSDIQMFLNFREHWPEGQMVFLGENYRSTQNIIKAASGLIAHNTEKPKELEDQALYTNNPLGELVTIVEMHNESAEAAWIAKTILGKNQNEKKQFAILYRTNAQSRAIEQALIDYNLPYKIYGGVRFYERLEIKDILAAVRFAFNSKDTLSVERLQKNMGKRKTEEITNSIGAFTTLDPATLIEKFLETSDYFEYLERNFTNAVERKENIAELIRFAQGFDRVEEFLERATLLQSTDTSSNQSGATTHQEESSQNLITLMTIHMAKGLEFDSVFIAGATEGILPHQLSIESPKAIEEERRLMYVAMTRAKQKLFISFFGIPSRFLAEIPTETTEFDGTRALDDEERYISWD